MKCDNTKIKIDADLIIYDELSIVYYNNGQLLKPLEYTTKSLTEKSLGGTEFQLLLLMHEYTKLGKKVICFNNNIEYSIENEIEFIPRKFIKNYDISCKNLITSRFSDIPFNIKFDKCFIWMHDAAMPICMKFNNILKNCKNIMMICPSNWSKSLLPKSWNVNVINNMIPDWVYSYKSLEQKKDFIYASSRLKGLDETLYFWNFINNERLIVDKKLKVLNPGYDAPNNDFFKDITVNYIGSLPFHKVVEEISKSESLFYVNKMPETFCIVAALCEILGTKMHILTLYGDGALKEILNTDCIHNDYIEFINMINNIKETAQPKDYRISTVFEKWKEFLN